MPIEFPCPNCGQKLRVGDDAAGRSAKCPACNGIAPVPVGMQSASFAPQKPAYSPPSPYTPAANPYGPPSGFGGHVNPYASPSYMPDTKPLDTGHVGNQVVTFDDVWGHAFAVWQNNLGLLIAITLVPGILGVVAGFGVQALQMSLLRAGERDMAIAAGMLINVFLQIVQTYLSIGRVQIALKLARGQRAEFTDLFGGGAMLLPVIGFLIVVWFALTLGFLLLIIPGIILLVMYWPSYYLLIDGKAGIFESFGLAGNATANNHGTTIVCGLAGVGLIILGALACGIGVLFAYPLVTMIFATAYLMMSGQIPTRRPAFTPMYQPPGGAYIGPPQK